MTSEHAGLPADIIEYIRECMGRKNGESYLIPVLQQIQNRFGYLSRDYMDEVSQLMQIPAVRVTGVATFYHFFSFVPKGRNKITICMGTACFVRGADKVLARLSEILSIAPGQTTPDGKFSLSAPGAWVRVRLPRLSW
jgi:NADH:ubiquinone oxidoreductase subunit E